MFCSEGNVLRLYCCDGDELTPLETISQPECVILYHNGAYVIKNNDIFKLDLNHGPHRLQYLCPAWFKSKLIKRCGVELMAIRLRLTKSARN